MAGEDQEKTEEPTSKKIEDARKDGNVPKSQDIGGFVTLVIGILVLLAMLDFMRDQVVALYTYYQKFIGAEITPSVLYQLAINSLVRILLMILLEKLMRINILNIHMLSPCNLHQITMYFDSNQGVS